MPLGDERHTGAEAIISIPEGNDVPVSNVSWDRDVNTTEVQHTGTSGTSINPLKPTIAVTGLRYSGSFEYDGRNENLRNQLWQDNGEPKRVTMTVTEEAGRDDGESDTTTGGSPRTFTFTNVMITGMSRDVPADDVSSTSWDFVAEDLNVS